MGNLPWMFQTHIADAKVEQFRRAARIPRLGGRPIGGAKRPAVRLTRRRWSRDAGASIGNLGAASRAFRASVALGRNAADSPCGGRACACRPRAGAPRRPGRGRGRPSCCLSLVRDLAAAGHGRPLR